MIGSRRTAGGSHLALPVTLVITLAVALLPAPWRLSWQNDLREIVRFPLTPFTHGLGRLAAWLRPPPLPAETIDPGERNINQLIEDRDLAQKLYQAERQRVAELEEQLQQLQQIPLTARSQAEPVLADITARSPGSPHGSVEFRLHGPLDRALPANTPAVYASVHLLGRTIDEGSRFAGTLIPLTSKATGELKARIVPRGQPLREGEVIYVRPTGGGSFLAEVDRLLAVEAGDIVRLDDSRWTRAAQMCEIGRVESLEVDEQEPLRQVVTIRPTYVVSQVAYVALLIERERAVGSP